MYRSIYVPMDNSSHALAAADLAIAIARQAGAGITGSHVYAAKLHDLRFRQMEGGLPERYVREDKLLEQRDIHDDLITRGLQLIADSYLDVFGRKCAEAGLTGHRVSLEGRNWQQLVADIARGPYDLVVMGALGLGSVESSEVGSVSERVARRIDRDLLVVRRGLEDGDGGIAVALDGSPRSFGGLRTALALGRAFGRPVEAVSAFDPLFHYVAFSRIAGVLSPEAASVFRLLVCTGRGVSQTDLSGEAYEMALGRIARLQEARSGLLIRVRCAPYLRRILGLRAGEDRGGDAAWSGACLAGRTYVRITPDGRVTPCPYIPAAVGDLRRSNLRTIWEGAEDLARLRAGAPGGKCSGCDFRVSCGGCRARAWAATGDLMAEDPKCSYRPTAQVVPEALAFRAASGPRWSPEAQDLLERIPGFVRARVRGRLEALAQQNGVDVITLDYMQAHRPRMPLPAALRPR